MSINTNTSKELITTKEASKRLFLTEYTIRKYIRRGVIKAKKLNKHYLIPCIEIEKLLDDSFRMTNQDKEKQVSE